MTPSVPHLIFLLFVCLREHGSCWSHKNGACKMPDATNAIRYLKIASLVALLEIWTRPCFSKRGDTFLLSCCLCLRPEARVPFRAPCRWAGHSRNQTRHYCPVNIMAVPGRFSCSPSALCCLLFLDLWWFAVKLHVAETLKRPEPDLGKENEVSTLLILRFEMHSKETFISPEFKQPQSSEFILQSYPRKKVMFLCMCAGTESDCKNEHIICYRNWFGKCEIFFFLISVIPTLSHNHYFKLMCVFFFLQNRGHSIHTT